MRVLLLFYLAPLWTVLLARLLLGERITPAGAGVVALSLAGAVTMLWHPELGTPWPRAGAEWLGLAAGFLFALANVLIRRASHYPIELKTLAVFAGVVLVGLGYLALAGDSPPAAVAVADWGLLVLVGLVLLAVNLVVQYGLTRVAASRAIVIFLFELVVAAAAAWWLAGEAMGPREWVGGLLIVGAQQDGTHGQQRDQQCPGHDHGETAEDHPDAGDHGAHQIGTTFAEQGDGKGGDGEEQKGDDAAGNGDPEQKGQHLIRGRQ